MDERLYSVEEAAERLGITVRTMQNWLARGVFPGAYKSLPGGVTSPWQIPESDLARVEEQRRGSS